MSGRKDQRNACLEQGEENKSVLLKTKSLIIYKMRWFVLASFLWNFYAKKRGWLELMDYSSIYFQQKTWVYSIWWEGRQKYGTNFLVLIFIESKIVLQDNDVSLEHHFDLPYANFTNIDAFHGNKRDSFVNLANFDATPNK